MKILFLNRYQDKVERGAEIFVSELASKLNKNHDVQIFSGEKADSLKDVLSGKFDIVIPINGRLQSLMVSLGRLIGGYKVLITGHSGIGRDDIWNIVICKPDVFVALTDYMASWAKKWAWGSRVVKIPNGVDLKKFSPRGAQILINLRRPIMLSAGALVWYKHHDRVIRAVAGLKQGSLLIAGEGEEYLRLQKLGKGLLGDRFKIANFKNKDMPKVYRGCNLFTLPSWDREAFGIVYLEAMATNLPIVAPNDLSRKEIVGEGGVLVDVDDESKYPDAIKLALDTNWKGKPRQQAEKFSWDKIAKQYENIMLEMLRK